MRKKIQIAILLLVFGLFVSQGTLTAYAETEGSGEGGSMVVTQEGNASSDTTLSSLKIAQAALHPEFDPDQLTYTATVPYEVERVALTAQTNCPDARKVIRGTSDLEVGENTITITVTAQNGSTREYRITLTRQEMVETSAPETSAPEGESPDMPQTSEGEDVPATSESTEEPSTSESASESEEESQKETTPAETIIIPPDTEGNGGMVVETPGVNDPDDENLFSRQTLLILLGVAIAIVSLFAIVALVIVRREADDDEDDDDEDEELDDDLFDEEIPEEIAAEQTEESLDDDDFEEIPAEQVIVSQKVITPQNVATPQPQIQPEEDDDDLDDDFEMLLEDDDDFDFLDF